MAPKHRRKGAPLVRTNAVVLNPATHQLLPALAKARGISLNLAFGTGLDRAERRAEVLP